MLDIAARKMEAWTLMREWKKVVWNGFMAVVSGKECDDVDPLSPLTLPEFTKSSKPIVAMGAQPRFQG
jgi:hypothetical protein